MSGPAALAVALLTMLALAGCASSFDTAKKLEEDGVKAAAPQKGLSIATKNPDITVERSATITDPNGTAVVVTLKSTAKADQLDVPIAIDVLGKKKVSVFKNDTAGLEPSLVSMAVVKPGVSDWVNDQVQPAEPATSVTAEIGLPKTPATGVPKLTVTPAKIEDDPTSGILAQGTVKNDGTIAQVKLVAYGVARKGTKVVAAGRAVIPKLAPGKTANYRIFFIGDPRKGTLSVSVPPTTFR